MHVESEILPHTALFQANYFLWLPKRYLPVFDLRNLVSDRSPKRQINSINAGYGEGKKFNGKF